MTRPYVIFFDAAGPLIRYDGRVLRVENLNPEISTQWVMSRKEMFLFGLRAIFAAVKP